MRALHQLLPRIWLRRGPLACLLWPASVAMGALVALRRSAYRRGWLASTRLTVPVIVVGNVVAGGAGKTPVVIALVQHLQARGLQVGVLSRGYGRSSNACLEVSADTPLADSGDEPALLKRKCAAPVFVATRRVDAAQALLAAYPDTQVLVSDDGLQHLALARDIEICVFDDRGVGNGWLLPAGPLREPWPRPIDLVLHSGQAPAFGGYTGQRRLGAFATNGKGQQLALTSLRDQPVQALAGIAQPTAFFAMLRQIGLTLASTQALPDHANFSSWRPAEPSNLPLLCTEKDAHKLWQHCPEAWAVPLEFVAEAGFFDAIEELLAPLLVRTLSSPASSH